mmetsp:Transcript_11671/g.11592  ORF Transcript_11671/g.11592 Transcript_11671/m.11592 type:complete len:90 (+) Transcript_11671:105-374(+)
MSQFVEKIDKEESKLGGGKKQDLESDDQNWYELRFAGKYPERRGYHSSFIYNHKLFIFGGRDIREGTMGSMWQLDLLALDDFEKSDLSQ